MPSASKCLNPDGMSSIVNTSSDLVGVLKKCLPEDFRIIINGATGWFGSNISSTFSKLYGDNFDSHVLLTASRDQTLSLPSGAKLQVSKWNKESISQFAPTYVLHLAFKTRDHVNISEKSDYVATNMAIINDAKWMIALPSVKGFMHTSSGAAIGVNASNIDLDPYGYLKSLEELKYRKICEDLGKAYIGVRVWSATGEFIKTGVALAIEDLIQQALLGDEIRISIANPIWRSYADANQILIAGLLGLLSGAHGLYNSGGITIEIEALAKIVAEVIPSKNRFISRMQNLDFVSSTYTSPEPSIEFFLHKFDTQYSDIKAQVETTVQYLRQAL